MNSDLAIALLEMIIFIRVFVLKRRTLILNMPDFPTPFEAVNVLLVELRWRAYDILTDQWVGMYLFGSLTSGDFDRDSDIDVLIVTSGELGDAAFAALRAMHAHLSTLDPVWGLQLELSYIPRGDLRRYDPAQAVHPHLDRGVGEVLHQKQHSTSWVVQRRVLRERGIVIDGAALETLIDPVSGDDLRRAMIALVDEWAEEVYHDPGPLRRRGEQSYTALSMCRMLYTLEFGEVLSKRAAATWAQATLDPRWRPLLDRAWIGRSQPDTNAEPDDIAKTVALVRYVHERSQAISRALNRASP